MTRGATEYAALVAAHWPEGDAWPREPGTQLARLWSWTGSELARVDARVGDLLREADPRQASETLDEWERAFGLPDECSAGLTLIEQRRAALLARITERLSPSIPTIEALAASYGVRASVVEHRPHTCESSCEDPVNDEAWAHAWTVWGSGRVIWDLTCEDDCEQPLRLWSDLPHECALRRLAPAHTVPLFGSFTDEWSFLGGLPAGATFTRPAPANRVNSLGATESMGVNVPRLGYQAGLEYNLVPNPWGDGLTAGTPGSFPAGWSGSTTSNGITRTIIGSKVDGDVHGPIIQFTGTAAASGLFEVLPAGFGPAAVAGETWSASMYLALLDGSLPPGTRRLILWGRTGANGQVDPGMPTAVAPVNAPIGGQLFTASHTLSNVTAVAISMDLEFLVTAGDDVNLTLHIGFPALVKAASPITDRVPIATLAARINAVPQYGLLGLMLEAGASEELRLAVPEGLYTAQMVGATPAGAVATYHQPLLASVGGSLRVQWPAAAIADGANHLRSLILRKVL